MYYNIGLVFKEDDEEFKKVNGVVYKVEIMIVKIEIEI